MLQILTNKEIVKIYLPATKDEFLEVSRHEHNLKMAADNILLEYCKLKVCQSTFPQSKLTLSRLVCLH